MINFVVVEDNENYRKHVEDLIINYMMKNKYEFKISSFGQSTKTLSNLIQKNDENNIFILDFELPNATAIDISREIRKYDWRSPIIILTAHAGLAYESFKQRLQILDFISKQYKSDQNLKELFDICLKQFNIAKSLKFKTESIDYNISFDKIYYIYRDTYERKIYIVTENNEYKVRLGLRELKEELPDEFKFSSKACIINTKKVEAYDWKKLEIIFKNGISINQLSRTHKKELSE